MGTVAQIQGVVITATPDSNICNGTTVTLTANPFGGPNLNNLSYLWNNGDVTQSVTRNPSSTTIYSVTVSQPNQDDVSDQITITVGAGAPTWNADPPPILVECGGQQVNIAYNATAPVKWTNNNTNIGLAASGTGNISFTSTNQNSNQLATIEAYPENNGCKGPSKFTTLRIISTPGKPQQGNITACVGQTIPDINFSSTPTASEYTWTTAGDNIGLTPGVSGTGKIPSFKITGVGMVSVTVHGSNTFTSGSMITCTGPDTTFKIIGTAPPTFTKPAPAATVFCPGSPVSIPLMGTPGATFSWTNSNAAIGLASSGTGNLAFTPVNTGSSPATATITVTPKVNDNCVGSPETFTITVNPKPSSTVGAQENSGKLNNDGKICKGDPVTLEIVGGATCAWQGPSGLTPPTSCTWGNINLSSNFTFAVTVTNSFSCTTTATKAITVQPDPGLSFSVQSPCIGETLTLTSVPTGFTSYEWKLGTAVVQSGSANSYVKNSAAAADAGNYTLTVIDAENCDWAFTRQVAIEPKPNPQLAQESGTVCKNAWAVYRVENPTSISDSKFTWKITPGLSPADTVRYGAVLFVHWRNTGNYTIEVTESLGSNTTTNCIGVASKTVMVDGANTAPDAADIGHFLPNNILINKDDQVTCYQWGYFDPSTNAFVILDGETYQAYGAGETFSANRKYWVKTWNATDCTTPTSCATVSFRVKPIASIPGDTPRLHLYPNPNAGAFQVEVSRLKEAEYTLVINDVLGRIIQQKQVQVGPDGLLNETVQLDGAANGLYYVALRHDKGTLLARAVSIYR